MKAFVEFLWVIVIVAAILGAIVAAGSILSASSAPQQVAGIGVGICIVIFPYLIARAFQEIYNSQK